MITCIDGWEHLSVSHKNKIPSWECMNEMKEMFFKDDEECFQFHPKKEDYINNNVYTLHIWRRTDGKMETPPRILVGFRKGHEEEDLQEAIELHKRIGCPLSNEDIRWLRASSMGDDELDKFVKNMSQDELLRLCAKMGII